MNAYVAYFDHDPLAFWEQVATFQLNWSTLLKQYAGATAPTGNRIELTFVPTTALVLWTATLTVYSPFAAPDVFTYLNIPADPAGTFGTPKFGDVVISGIDYRILQILE